MPRSAREPTDTAPGAESRRGVRRTRPPHSALGPAPAQSPAPTRRVSIGSTVQSLRPSSTDVAAYVTSSLPVTLRRPIEYAGTISGSQVVSPSSDRARSLGRLRHGRGRSGRRLHVLVRHRVPDLHRLQQLGDPPGERLAARILAVSELAAWLEPTWSDRAVAVAAFATDGPTLFGGVRDQGLQTSDF